MTNLIETIKGFPNWDGLLRVELWIAAAFAIFAFCLPLARTAKSFISQMRSAHYSELDRIYMEILKMGIDRPFLRDRKLIPEYVSYLRSQNKWLIEKGLNGTPPAWSGDVFPQRRQEALQYDTYAFVVFNFLETIHDRCDENCDRQGRADPKLRGTWEGIIGAELKMHSEWFEYETKPYCSKTRDTKFCVEFSDFMWSKKWEVDEKWGYRSEVEIRASFPDNFRF